MSPKQVFNVKDKVFAKIRGYPARPAMVTGVKADTPSQLRYKVYFYGTGERAECKPEDLFSYKENKSQLGKPNKRKYFAEALSQIDDENGNLVVPENEAQVLVTPSKSSNIEPETPVKESESVIETEKVNETISESKGKLSTDESTNMSKGRKVVAPRKSLGLTISKGTKRKISDTKPEIPVKKSMSNKPKSSDNVKIKESSEIVKIKENSENLKVKEISENVMIKKNSETVKNIENSENIKNEESSEYVKIKKNQPIVLVEKLLLFNVDEIKKAKTNSKQNAENTTKNVVVVKQTSENTNKDSETINTFESVLNASDASLDNSKSAKTVSKVKSSPASSSKISSININLGQVSRSGRKIKPKKFFDDENDAEVPKRSRLSKENSKTLEKQNSSIIDNDNSLKQTCKTKDSSSNSKIKKSSKSHGSSSVPPYLNNDSAKKIPNLTNKVKENSELPDSLKRIMVDTMPNLVKGWEIVLPSEVLSVEMLITEVDLLDYINKLRSALRVDRANYDVAMEVLECISELQINALMLKKNKEAVEIIVKVSKYIGNAENWNLSEDNLIEHIHKASLIRHKAETVYNKFVSLFTIPDGQSFKDVFDKEVEDFYAKTEHLTCDQIYNVTSEKYFK